MPQYSKSIAQLEKEFQTNRKIGLTEDVVRERSGRFGKNELPSSGSRVRFWRIFLNQWKSPLIIILLVAATVSGLLGEHLDMGIIYITALLNACIGFFQEYKANASLDALRSFVSFSSIVLRDGKKQQISSSDIVPGDIVFLEAGDTVPADGRLISLNGFAVNEAALTGESVPVKKQTAPIAKDVALAERKNMVFKGTSVSEGVAMYVVTAIGKDTELGIIARLVKETHEEVTPLQKQLALIAKKLSVIIVCMALFIFMLGLLFGKGRYSVFELFQTAIAVAVAAIPEGLVISLTVILAIGMQFILKKHALVRRLVAAETLGSVSVICTDKTGTLTEGNMSVVRVMTASAVLTQSQFSLLHDNTDATLLTTIGIRCNNALEKKDTQTGVIQYVGDTTETALLKLADASGIVRMDVDATGERIQEMPFSSDTKYMATVHRTTEGNVLSVKGAPEVVLEKSSAYVQNGKKIHMTEKQKKLFFEEASRNASLGYRTLSLAYAPLPKEESKNISVSDLVYVGMVAIADPVRPDVRDVIALTKAAGIRVMMITGDHKDTAYAVAKELGLVTGKENKERIVCEGKEIDACDDRAFEKRVRDTMVFARVSPEHKIRIVKALQASGAVVAMTGDGVNDAPAIKGADIGIAVGSGSDVAKQTADMVLLENSFGTIVAAVEQGRIMYRNIKKIVLYLLSSSFAEVVMITASILAGFPVAALPAQILWVNILQDSFPTMALAFDGSDTDTMQDTPRKKDEQLIDRDMKIMILLKSIVSNIALFAIFVYIFKTTQNIALARTMVFVGFAVDALFYIFSIRNLRQWIWQFNPLSNRYLLAAVAFGWCMLALAVYAGPLQLVLQTVPLTLSQWGSMLAFGICNLILMEAMKGIFFIRKKKHTPSLRI